MSRVKSKGRVSTPAIRPAPLDVRRALASFDSIGMVADEFRDMVAEQAPDLLAKLPKPPAKSRKAPGSGQALVSDAATMRRRSAKELRRWRITVIRHKDEHVGTVKAPDAEAAIRITIEEYAITDPHRQRRLVAQPVE